MKVHDCEQGSARWHALRIGIPTASEFGRILTPGGKPSKQSRDYAYRLVAERLLHAPSYSLASTEWMERGRELEPRAARQYEFAAGVETYKVGFVTTDSGKIGASPDRLIKGDARAVEIKCPAPGTMLRYSLEQRADEYRPQRQGQMLVAELDRVDFYAFHPMMPALLLRCDRDEAYLKLLGDALAALCDELDDMEFRARKLGIFQEYAGELTPREREAADANAALPTWLQGL